MLTGEIKAALLRYLMEDEGKGDVTASITPRAKCLLAIKANEPCRMAGIEEVEWLFRKHGFRVKSLSKDGSRAKRGQKVLEAAGENRKALTLERVCLNVLGRMSGVATLCAEARKKAPRVLIAVTRKTSPGFQSLDKKAAQTAGCWTHRKNLDEMILLKENHLEFFPSITVAIKAAKKVGKKIEVEVETLAQALEAARAKPDYIMLDNFSPATARKTIAEIRKTGFKGKIELSGGITLKNLQKYNNLGADIISMGELTKNARIIDFSTDMKRSQDRRLQ